MTKFQKIKQQLNCVFDDDLHTKVWHNILDWIIICLIVISSLEVFLSTFDGIAQKYGSILHFIDVFTTIFFTIEVSLRIWLADLLDPKYKGFWGRVRYCFSFYGLIDILSTYPALFGLFFKASTSALKIFRIARLFRIFRYMKSFRILGQAVSSKKQELGISMLFLTILTVILSFLLYYAEHGSQPDMCDNGLDTLIWAFAKYLGDPGKIADYPMVTPWGHIIAAIVGVLGIAIFAVPAGLISSGFIEVIEEDKHQRKVEENSRKLHLAFESKQDRYTLYQIVPQFLSIPEIKAKMRMAEEDVFEAIDNSNVFRVVNLASTIPIDKNPQDRLAVEHFVVNTSYGCKIDRGSKVTIVALSNAVDPVIGHFAYYMAKIGGFNYISREIGATRPYKSFLYYSPDEVKPNQEEFMKDVNEFTSKEGSWVINLMAASGANEPEYPTQIHFGYGGPRGDESFDAPDLLIHDIPFADKLMSSISEEVERKYGITTDRQRYHQCIRQDIYIRSLENFAAINGLLIRVAWSVSCHDPRRIAIAKSIADVIHEVIEPEHEIPNPKEMTIKSLGFDSHTSEPLI